MLFERDRVEDLEQYITQVLRVEPEHRTSDPSRNAILFEF